MFTVKLSMALLGGLILSLPVLLFQFWKFISPAFEDKYGFVVFIAMGCGMFYFTAITDDEILWTPYKSDVRCNYFMYELPFYFLRR